MRTRYETFSIPFRRLGTLSFALALLTGFHTASAEEETKSLRNSKKAVYSSRLKMHRVDIPDFEKQTRNPDAEGIDRSNGRFKDNAPTPGSGRSTFSNYQKMNKTAPKKKKPPQKNWILPPLPDDLKKENKALSIMQNSEELEESATGWGWLADMVTQRDRPSAEERATGRRYNRDGEEEEDEKDDDGRYDRNRDEFDQLETAFNRDDDLRDDRGQDSKDRFTTRSLSEEDVERKVQEALRKAQFKDDETKEADPFRDSVNWRAEDRWNPEAEKQVKFSETDGILKKYQSAGGVQFSKEPKDSNSFEFEKQLSASSKDLLAKYSSPARNEKPSGEFARSSAARESMRATFDRTRPVEFSGSTARQKNEGFSGSRVAGEPTVAFRGSDARFNRSGTPAGTSARPTFSLTPKQANPPTRPGSFNFSSKRQDPFSQAERKAPVLAPLKPDQSTKTGTIFDRIRH